MIKATIGQLIGFPLKYDIVCLPFLGTDKNSIKEAKALAKREYPGAKKLEYIKPYWIQFKGRLAHESFWTFPEIKIYLSPLRK